MRVASSLVVGLISWVALAGCEADLGTCDMTLATQVVYSTAGTPYYPGQAVVQQSCASGLCHASGAVDASRVGAPHGLNFDVAPLTAQSTSADIAVFQAGLAKVRDESHDMWGEIDDGSMPPGTAGKRVPQNWNVQSGTGLQPVTLDIQTSAGKAHVRNWLACGAPVVAGVTGAQVTATATEAVLPGIATTAATATFTSIYNTILKGGTCVGCHVAGGLFPSIDLTSQASAYSSLFSKDSSTAANAKCGGRKLVTPGNCDTSLLYEKLAATTPAVCGDRMPQGGAPIAETDRQTLCDWIKAGAMQN
jgi:hypothetical protein